MEPGPARPADVTATPLSGFNRFNGDTQFGHLTWRGGLELTSTKRTFGGWSAMAIAADGSHMLAISDRGRVLRANLVNEAGHLVGVDKAELLHLPQQPRAPGASWDNIDYDAEAVTVASGTIDKGEILVAFEGSRRIAHLSIDGDNIGMPARYLQMPPETALMRDNKIFEGVTVLRGGPYKNAVVAIAEKFANAKGENMGWIWQDGRPLSFSIRIDDDFSVSDCTSLDNGGLVILERRFSWLSGIAMRLRYIKPQDLRPGAVVSGEILLEAGMTSEIDNMEAIAASHDDKGTTILTLISDDNFNHYMQRTLLMQFAVDPALVKS